MGISRGTAGVCWTVSHCWMILLMQIVDILAECLATTTWLFLTADL
jgi:hypothetical protein